MMSELQEIRNVFHGLETLYHTYLPKVDPVLLHDLLIREDEKSERAPFYMVEVFLLSLILIQNDVNLTYGKLLALFRQYMIKELTM
ncbi:MAG: hypothetical protein ACJ71F_00370 [Nitrososphaeraceae archaeon]